MKKLIVLLMTGTFCSFALLLGGPGAGAQEDQLAPDQEGVEVLTRGPMHEAYAAPESLDPKPSPIVPKKPPEPVPEMPPDQKPEGSHVVWISGYWAWDDEPAEFAWISGFWRDLPPGKRWVPGHWMEIQGGWQWVSGLWAGETQAEVNYVPPPPPSLDTGPSAPAPEIDQFYSPGCWVYVERQYRWRPGFWMRYRPSWVYIPAHYIWTPAGCVFVDGYWDYELTRRGLLFCPIRFTANVWTRPGWRFSPHYIVYPEVIVGALFVRPDFHRYCFGDYFGPKFVEHGFVPWVDYRLHRNIPEPLFHQVAWHNRKNETWERDLRKLYDDRRTGLAPRPPRSFAQQQQFMRDLAEHKTIKTTGKNFAIKDVKVAERNLLMVNPIAKVDRNVIPLKKLTPAVHADVIKTVEHHNDVRLERKTVETKIFKDTPPFKPTDPHQVGKLPVIPKHLETPTHVTPPPAIPVIPKHVEKVVPKYDPPKPPHANPKPLPKASADRQPEELTAHAEWLAGRPKPLAARSRSAPALL
jgi:hypothetical protein